MFTKKIITIVTVVFLCCLCGCNISPNKKEELNTSFTKEETNSSNTLNEDTNYYNKGFEFSASLNVFLLQNENLIAISETPISLIDDKLTLLVSTSASPDSSLCWGNINLDVSILCNGSFVNHCIEGNEKKTTSSICIKTNEEAVFTIDILKEDLQVSSDSLVTIVCNYAPDYCADNGMCEFGGIVTYQFVVCKNIQETTYSEIPYACSNDYFNYYSKESFFDIGYMYNGNNQIVSNHMYEKIMINKENKLAIKASLGEKINSDYYVGVLCDGQWLPIFNENYFMIFNTACGNKLLNFELNTDVIPNGKHSLQAIFIPCNNKISEFTEFTKKHTIIVEK